MAVINDPNTAANIVGVGQVATGGTGAAHVTLKPIPTTVGAYRVSHRTVLLATQAANSRVFEIRNTHATNLIIPTKLGLRLVQTADHTAAISNSLDVFKVTGFTAVDTTNTETPSASLKRAGFTAAPGNSVIRGLAVAGHVDGMTGGTLTKDSRALYQMGIRLVATVPTATPVPTVEVENVFKGNAGSIYPLVLAQNEGIIVENRVLLGAAAGSDVYLDFEWVEVTAY